MAAPDLTNVATIPINGVLNVCHPDYDRDCIIKYRDFYVGGEKFEKRKDKYMRPRAIETGQPEYKHTRARCYAYVPHVAGIIDDLVGSAIASPPRIEVNKPDDPRAKYWLGLNQDMNGRGQDFFCVFAGRFAQECVQHRSYITIIAPPIAASGAVDRDLHDSKTRGKLDFFIGTLDAVDVDDWQRDKDDQLEWVRTHVIRLKRSSDYAPMDTEKHVWTFITPDYIFEYQAERKINTDGWPKDAVATKVNKDIKHGIGALPVIPVVAATELHVMDRVLAVAEALFNREGAREFALDMAALSLPVVTGPEKPGGMALTVEGCIWPGPQGDLKYVSPDGNSFTALEQACKDLRDNLYSAIQAMAQNAALQNQNARQSGTAKMQDKGPMFHLLTLLTQPVIIAFQRALNIIAAARNEASLTPLVKGADQYDTQDAEIEINKVNTLANIPNISQVPSLLQHAIVEMANMMYPNAPPDIKAQWQKDAANIKPIDPLNPPAPIRDGKGAPAGQQPDRMKAQSEGQNNN